MRFKRRTSTGSESNPDPDFLSRTRNAPHIPARIDTNAPIPEDLPPKAHALAKRIAEGHDASLGRSLDLLEIPNEDAQAWMSAPWWRTLLRTHYVDDEWVQDRDDELLPAAERVYRKILTDEAMDPKVRLSAARDIYGRKGHASTRRETKETFTPPNADYARVTVLELFGTDAKEILKRRDANARTGSSEIIDIEEAT